MKHAPVLIVLSDMHCGSNVGLAAPASKQKAGNEIHFGENHAQRWLWENWLHAVERVRDILAGDKGVLLVNGDATEGIHHRTEEIVAASIEEHAGIAVQCLQPWLKLARSTIVIRGTECHTHDIESLVAVKIGAEGDKAYDKRLFKLKGTRCLVDAAHHVGVTSRAYLEASQLSIAMGNARQNYLRAGHEAPAVFLRGHRHCGGWYSDGGSAMGVTGGWQMLTRHGKKVVTDSIPRPSVLVLDWRDTREVLPRVHQIVFNPPQDEIASI